MTCPRDMTGSRVHPAAAADMPAVYALRHEVFVLEQQVPAELERDELDETAGHVVALDGTGVVVGTGRVVEESDGVAHLGRLAVRRHARGTGVGVALVRGLEERARASGLRCAVLGAQVHAVGFYQRLGYTAYGEVFDDAGIDHRWMRRDL